jgi:hypothetical protein
VYWVSRGLEPTAVFDVEILETADKDTWMALADCRVWRRVDLHWYDPRWEVVHNPLEEGGGDWNDPWGANFNPAVHRQFGVDGIDIQVKANDPSQVFATCSNVPYSPLVNFDSSDDNLYPGTGAVLRLDYQPSSGNEGWELWGDVSVMDPNTYEGWGVAPRIAIDWDTETIHTAAHGNGYWKGQTTSANSFQRINYASADIENHCFAVTWFSMARQAPLPTAMAIDEAPATLPSEKDRIGEKKARRVLLGHSTFDGRVPTATGGIWYSNGAIFQQAVLDDPGADMDYLDVLCLEKVSLGGYVLAGCWDQRQGNGYGIVLSQDNGITWSPVIWDASAPPKRVVDIEKYPGQPNVLFAAAAEPEGYHDPNAGIWYSTDYGCSWYRCSDYGIGSLHMACLKIDPNEPGTLLVGTGGNGLWRGTINQMAREVRIASLEPMDDGPIDDRFSDDSLFLTATPVDPEWTRHLIEWSIPNEMDRTSLTLAVYDLGGRLIKELMQTPIQPGPYRRVWPSSEDAAVRAGSYICVLRAPGAMLAKKIVVVK